MIKEYFNVVTVMSFIMLLAGLVVLFQFYRGAKITRSIILEREFEWISNLEVEPVMVEYLGKQYNSSGRLSVSWEIPERSFDHFQLILDDEISGVRDEIDLPAELGALELSGLKSATDYSVSIALCLDENCYERIEGDVVVSARTGEEYWMIEGEEEGYESAAQVVEDGSTLSYVLPYGDWAPPELQGMTKLFYNAKDGEGNNFEGGIRVASSSGYELFEDVKALFLRECRQMTKGEPGKPPQPDTSKCPEDQLEMFAFQVVPLLSKKVRLFFEASSPGDEEHITQIYALDSYDLYEAEDFDSSPESDVCGDGEARELIPGGTCEPELLIGSVERGVDSGLRQARQHKIGYPMRDSWLWDEAPGTFMVVTGADACEQTRDGLFYAVLNGAHWNVESDNNCAKPLVRDAHGPVLVHMGQARYKLYFENYLIQDREKNLWEEKPTRVLYGDGALHGQEDVVDFEDWEDESLAREVHFLWPNGTVLSSDEEAGLGDHMVFLPNADLKTQVMYMNLGGFDNREWSAGSAGLGMAILVNP